MSVTSSTKSESGLGETIRVVIHALLIALVIRTFLFQPFNIPSGSMKATLLVGDYLFVSKYSYGYSHYSLPFSPPLFSGRIFGREPKRGDVLVTDMTDPNWEPVMKLASAIVTNRGGRTCHAAIIARELGILSPCQCLGIGEAPGFGQPSRNFRLTPRLRRDMGLQILASLLEQRVKAHIGVTATVEIAAAGTVERSLGKAKRVIDRRPRA